MYLMCTVYFKEIVRNTNKKKVQTQTQLFKNFSKFNSRNNNNEQKYYIQFYFLLLDNQSLSFPFSIKQRL